MDDVEAIEELLAKQAITEVLFRYCRGIDRMDRALVLSCWHPDGTADYGDVFTGTCEGFVDWVWPIHRDVFVGHSHQITNVLVELDDAGNRAVSEAYVTVALRAAAVGEDAFDLVGRGRYLDRWSCREGRWAIDHRLHLVDLRGNRPAPVVRGDADAATRSRRGQDDPSYELFGTGR